MQAKSQSLKELKASVKRGKVPPQKVVIQAEDKPQKKINKRTREQFEGSEERAVDEKMPAKKLKENADPKWEISKPMKTRSKSANRVALQTVKS
jgi:hypothetical protein